MINPLLLKHPFFYLKKKLCKYRYKYGLIPDNVSELEKEFNGIKFIFDLSLGPYIKKMYYGLYELKVKEAMKKYLKRGGVFLDIGANIGYLSAIGASLVGKDGVVHSFEPVPEYFKYLSKLVELNPDYNIVINNFALGESRDSACLNVAGQSKIGSNSMVPNFIPEDLVKTTITVPVQRLDRYAEENNLSCPSLIKVDVEGFELPVLKGASALFQQSKDKLPLVIVEITPSVNEQSNKDIAELEELMFGFGYKSYCTLGRHPIDIKKIYHQTDVLFKQETF